MTIKKVMTTQNTLWEKLSQTSSQAKRDKITESIRQCEENVKELEQRLKKLLKRF
jgi:TRAP-type C4-dicarboxylate transport system substrate-binding protein